MPPSDAANHYWSTQVNDLVGGFIVTNSHLPLSQTHDRKPMLVGSCDEQDRPHVCNVPTGHYVIAECTTQVDADTIASVLNRAGVRR